MANLLDDDVVVSMFELLGYYYVHFRMNALEKRYEFPSLQEGTIPISTLTFVSIDFLSDRKVIKSK